MNAATEISSELRALSDSAQAAQLSRFFKCGKGDYGEGDLFLGVRVPDTRAIVKRYWKGATTGDVDLLTRSPYHEERLAGFLTLVELYTHEKKKKQNADPTAMVDFYLSIMDRGNNWDLVDLVAPKILGDYLLAHPLQQSLLFQLSASGNLWKERVSIVATLPIIKAGDFSLTLDLALILAPHPHDLIHKATGWMLREVGKKNQRTLQNFLDRHCTELSRTTLSYATERIEERRRISYRLQLNEAITTRLTGKAPAHIPMTRKVSSIKPVKKNNAPQKK